MGWCRFDAVSLRNIANLDAVVGRRRTFGLGLCQVELFNTGKASSPQIAATLSKVKRTGTKHANESDRDQVDGHNEDHVSCPAGFNLVFLRQLGASSDEVHLIHKRCAISSSTEGFLMLCQVIKFSWRFGTGCKGKPTNWK